MSAGFKAIVERRGSRPDDQNGIPLIPTRKRIAALLSALFLACGLLVAGFFAPANAAAGLRPVRLDPRLAAAPPDETVEFLVEMAAPADLSGWQNGWSKREKGEFIYRRLRAAAAGDQRAILAELRQTGAAFQPFWIVNAIWVRGPAALAGRIAGRPGVRAVWANPRLAQVKPLPAPDLPAPDSRSPLGVEWGLAKINAPLLWSRGVTGTGAVVGGQDTGYQWDHPALKARYRGWNGAVVDHNYNWFDAISTDLSGNGSNPCGYNLASPCDDNGHGTHTAGTMAGGIGGNGNSIGVAPGAQWIGCRNMEQGWGTPATYIACFEWFLAPTNVSGSNPDPARAPHVVNNSWSCPPAEGCNSGNFGLMQQAVENLRAAGVAVVVSAGNYGPSCGTVYTPAAIYDASISIGATNSGDSIAGFSSRGPVTSDGSGRLKPDLVAPGVAVYSTYRGGVYATLSGTSMAGPHVAGAIALLISAVPEAAGQVDLLEQALRETAQPLTTTDGCGGDGPTSVPNHTYGYGRIDVDAAARRLQALLTPTLSISLGGPAVILSKAISPTAAVPITYQLAISHAHPISAATDVVLTKTLPLETVFVTATLPHVFDGSTITWSWPSLFNESRSVTLTVEASVAPPATSATISSGASGVTSTEIPPSAAPPISTQIFRLIYQFLFPLVPHG